ncbi:winged helix-turn-helix domain-containing protein [Micromonospora sp. STR1s_5]|nr:winged helix-turn-helix domain-containing protein [Micromonospora sp. STR1s_5]
MQFEFADYSIDLDRRELTRRGEAIAIGPQVFDLLVYLLQNRERVVSKDDLLNAVWDGRIVSESTLTSHINAVRKAIGDSGGDQRLVRTIARKGFRFVGEVKEAHARNRWGALEPDPNYSPEGPQPALTLPDKPSIAVLPFLNLSGDPEQEYFGDGVVEDIITGLSRCRWLFVIARDSSFTFKGCDVDLKQVGRELGVRYVLEGSVRKAGHRVRITAQLIEATTGTYLWAERFEGTLDDIFELQDDLTTSVVGAIAPQLERAEIERAKRKPTGNLDAYDHYLRGMASLHRGTKAAVEEALPSFQKAVDADPEFSSAYALAAWCHFWRKINGWMPPHSQEILEGARLARRAVDLGRDDAVALARAGHALAHLSGDLDSGIALIDRALMLNPNLAAGWFLGGFLRIWRGEPEDAIERLGRAMRLSPLDTEMYRMQAGAGMAHLIAGRPDEASAWADMAFRHLPTFLIAVGVLAASHATAGRIAEARCAMRRMRELDPALRLSNLKDWLPLHCPEAFGPFSDGLRKAGLPE